MKKYSSMTVCVYTVKKLQFVQQFKLLLFPLKKAHNILTAFAFHHSNVFHTLSITGRHFETWLICHNFQILAMNLWSLCYMHDWRWRLCMAKTLGIYRLNQQSSSLYFHRFTSNMSWDISLGTTGMTVHSHLRQVLFQVTIQY